MGALLQRRRGACCPAAPELVQKLPCDAHPWPHRHSAGRPGTALAGVGAQEAREALESRIEETLRAAYEAQKPEGGA